MSMTFPNESPKYRAARNALLEREVALRRQMEAVAVELRALPPGGDVPEDYFVAAVVLATFASFTGRALLVEPPLWGRRHLPPSSSCGHWRFYFSRSWQSVSLLSRSRGLSRHA